MDKGERHLAPTPTARQSPTQKHTPGVARGVSRFSRAMLFQTAVKRTPGRGQPLDAIGGTSRQTSRLVIVVVIAVVIVVLTIVAIIMIMVVIPTI